MSVITPIISSNANDRQTLERLAVSRTGLVFPVFRKSVPISEICGCLRPSIHHSCACRRLLLAQGDGLGVEFFDFVGGGGDCAVGGSGWGFDFDFHQSFGEGFGVNDKWVGIAFGEVFVLQLACLRIGVDGEEVTLQGQTGEESAQAPLIFFDAFESRGS